MSTATHETVLERSLQPVFEALVALLRASGETAGAEAIACLQTGRDVPDSEAPGVARALNLAFQILNLLEAQAEAVETGPQQGRGGWRESLQHLQQAGLSELEMREILRTVTVTPVLTAHPTEARRLSVLALQRELAQWFDSGLAQQDWQRPAQQQQLQLLLERWWRTGETYLEKPSVAAERQHILHYLSTVFPEALQQHDQALQNVWAEAGCDPALLAEPDDLPRLTLGTWVGGDRDGHPGVTADLTAETLMHLRQCALMRLLSGVQ